MRTLLFIWVLLLWIGQAGGFDTDKFFKEQQDLQADFCKNEALHRNQEYDAGIELRSMTFFGASFRMFIRKGGHDPVSEQIHNDGEWEPMETTSFLTALTAHVRSINKPPSELGLLDIGANIGWYTILLGNLGYNVVAIEPDPYNMYILRRSLCINPQIKAITLEMAVGNETGRVCGLYNDPTFLSNSMVFCEEVENNVGNHRFRTKVIILPLDWFDKYIPPLVAIKIDIEGYEPFALAGGKKLFIDRKVKFIQAEYNPTENRSKKSNGPAFVRALLAAGYVMSTYRCTDPPLANDDAMSLAQTTYNNFNVCFRQRD